MRTPSETELLDLWEEGQVRHPIDRALLLFALSADYFNQLIVD